MRVRISDLLMNSLSVLKSNILCKASVSSVLVSEGIYPLAVFSRVICIERNVSNIWSAVQKLLSMIMKAISF